MEVTPWGQLGAKEEIGNFPEATHHLPMMSHVIPLPWRVPALQQ